jgi:uncharacterized repeat protein (TIGR01451 family)
MKNPLTRLSGGRLKKTCHVALAMLMVSLSLFSNSPAYAAPAAGTVISNQSSATYTDSSAVTYTATSNVVRAVVQQVASETLTASLSKQATPGSQISYPLTVTNTGNGSDNFNLAFSQSGTFAFSSVTFYADVNGDGIADNTTPITTTPILNAGDTYRFVAVGNVPNTAVAGNSNALVVTATSSFDATSIQSVTDTTTITTNATLNVTKTMSATSGAAGSGPYTITLSYNNTGNTAATAVTLKDAIPVGMTYVGGNLARSSITGATALTDANNADAQGGTTTVTYDYNVTAPSQVTAVISSVPAGQSGFLTFQVNIDPTASGSLANTANYSYNDGASARGPINTNTFIFTVNKTASVSFSGQTVASATQGSTVTFTNALVNSGTATDSFDISLASSTFPAGTTFTLFKNDGVTPLVDSNSNGTPDTGPLASGSSYNVVVKATLPAGSTGGPYAASFLAKSFYDNSKTATATDTLTTVTSNTVDLTANSSGGAAPGFGAGPEASSVVTTAINASNSARFTLYANNTSTTGDSYDLSASTDLTFASQALPSGWTVTFRDASNTVITNTGVITGGGNKLYYADVVVPAGSAATSATGTDLYFRLLSPSSGATDRLHNAVTVPTTRSIVITPNNSGQTYPGGVIVYSQRITNAGNVTENSGGANTVTLTTSSNNGFSSIVYLDNNSNNLIDAGDTVVSTAASLGVLAPGASKNILVKITAPAGVGAGVIDTTTLTATVAGTINTVAAPAAGTATDSTTVISGLISLLKEQAINVSCSGVPDTAYSTASVSTGLKPGTCIRYRITATNLGSTSAQSLVVSDASPAFTNYDSTAPAATTQGTVTAPANGASGTIQATIGTLTPSATAVLTFGVKVNP